eukprot:6509883-Pyramimonas_sp.AAC.1
MGGGSLPAGGKSHLCSLGPPEGVVLHVDHLDPASTKPHKLSPLQHFAPATASQMPRITERKITAFCHF